MVMLNCHNGFLKKSCLCIAIFEVVPCGKDRWITSTVVATPKISKNGRFSLQACKLAMRSCSIGAENPSKSSKITTRGGRAFEDSTPLPYWFSYHVTILESVGTNLFAPFFDLVGNQFTFWAKALVLEFMYTFPLPKVISLLSKNYSSNLISFKFKFESFWKKTPFFKGFWKLEWIIRVRKHPPNTCLILPLTSIGWIRQIVLLLFWEITR